MQYKDNHFIELELTLGSHTIRFIVHRSLHWQSINEIVQKKIMNLSTLNIIYFRFLISQKYRKIKTVTIQHSLHRLSELIALLRPRPAWSSCWCPSPSGWTRPATTTGAPPPDPPSSSHWSSRICWNSGTSVPTSCLPLSSVNVGLQVSWRGWRPRTS